MVVIAPSYENLTTAMTASDASAPDRRPDASHALSQNGTTVYVEQSKSATQTRKRVTYSRYVMKPMSGRTYKLQIQLSHERIA